MPLQTINRRQLIRSTLGASACLSAAAITAPALAGIPPLERPKPGVLRASLAAYSLRAQLTGIDNRSAEMDLFGFVDYCRSLGIHGTELTSYYFPAEVTKRYLLKLRRHCHLAGMTISGGAIRNDFCSTDEAKVERDIEHTKAWIRHYALLGAPAIRIFAGKQQKGEELDRTLERCTKHCQTVCDYAYDHGVMLALENHGGVTATAEGLLKIVRGVDSPAIGINFDSGNFKDFSDPYVELEKIAPYAVNAQVKVAVQIDGKKTEMDIPRVTSILSNAGYSGWVALEYEEEAPLENIPGWMAKLQAAL